MEDVIVLVGLGPVDFMGRCRLADFRSTFGTYFDVSRLLVVVMQVGRILQTRRRCPCAVELYICSSSHANSEHPLVTNISQKTLSFVAYSSVH